MSASFEIDPNLLLAILGTIITIGGIMIAFVIRVSIKLQCIDRLETKLNEHLETTEPIVDKVQQMSADVAVLKTYKENIDRSALDIKEILNSLASRTPFFETVLLKLENVGEEITKLESTVKAHADDDVKQFDIINKKIDKG